MSAKNISEKAIERSVSWIEAVEKAIAENTNEVNTKKIMKVAGEKCAQQILKECKQILGKKPENVDELYITMRVKADGYDDFEDKYAIQIVRLY